MSDEDKKYTVPEESTPGAGDAPADPASETVFVKVYAPSHTYFEGEANSISAVNQTGSFDILPKHHNFITLLVPCDVVVRTPTHEEKIRIQNGVMHVKADKIIVFLDV